MSHLGTLKLLNVILGVLMLIVAGLVLLAGVTPALLDGRGSGGELVAMAAIMVVAAGFLVGIGVLHLVTGGKVGQGRWRIVQTVLAVINLSNAPLGTAYGVYALWVCWMNEESKRYFV